jgi:methylated-DNA-[protein]-cysteine S-methyltransferase
MKRADKNLYADVYNLGGWRLWIAATDQGLCYVGTEERWQTWRGNNVEAIRDKKMLQPYADQLTEYFRGERTSFSLPIDAGGTSFQQSVWQALGEVPFGSKVSYTDIAAYIGKPEAVRAVGTAIGANPVLIVVPCHRVVGKNGALTGFREGLDMKRRLLDLEMAAKLRSMPESITG